MQYTVVHSKDPYLLARLATDLQMEGKKNDKVWNDMYNPFSKFSYGVIKYMQLSGKGDDTFAFFSHDCCGNNPTRHELTSRNYIKVLTQILEP